MWEESDNSKESKARLKKLLQEEVSQQNEEESRKKVEEIVENIKPIDDMPLDNKMAQMIKESPSTLMPYIKQVIDLEMWACFLREHLTKLEVEELLAKQRKVEEKHSIKENKKYAEEKLLKQIETLQKEFKKANWAKDLKKNDICPPSEPIYLEEIIPERPQEPVYKKPSFFNKSKVLEDNNRLKKEYDDALLVFQQQFKQYEENKKTNDRLFREYGVRVFLLYSRKRQALFAQRLYPSAN